MKVLVYSMNVRDAIEKEKEPMYKGILISFSQYRKDYTNPLTTTVIVQDDKGILNIEPLEFVQVVLDEEPVVSEKVIKK